MAEHQERENRIDPGIFDLIFEGAPGERMQAGQILFQQDDPAERLYGIVSGRVEISIYSETGRKLVANIQTAGLVGEIATLDGGSRTAAATCLSDCDIVSVSRTRLYDRMQAHPAIAMTMIRLLCDRLRRISGDLGDQALLNIEARLAKRLIALDATLAGADGWMALSQTDLAELLGATRESVNKTLKDWARTGLVELRRGAVRLADVRRIARLAGLPGQSRDTM